MQTHYDSHSPLSCDLSDHLQYHELVFEVKVGGRLIEQQRGRLLGYSPCDK
jgi:hypothetical protein